MKAGSALWQHTNDVICHIMFSQNVRVYNLIDDVICVHKVKILRRNSTHFTHCEFLGVRTNPKREVPLSRTLTCMGKQVDVDVGIISIPHEKSERYHICTEPY